MYHIYILHSQSTDKFYIGFDLDPYTQLEKHNLDTENKHTGKQNDWVIKAVFKVTENREDVLKAANFIKKHKTPSLINKLIDSSFIPSGELAILERVSEK